MWLLDPEAFTNGSTGAVVAQLKLTGVLFCWFSVTQKILKICGHAIVHNIEMAKCVIVSAGSSNAIATYSTTIRNSTEAFNLWEQFHM